MIASSKLPKKMTGATRAQLEAIGFVFSAEADDLFVNVVLPTGWHIQATEHSMYSELFDAGGACRASIFYKAAFYDRKADISFTKRYVVEHFVSELREQRHVAVCDQKTGKRLLELTPRHESDYQGLNADTKTCARWLDEQFPDSRDAMAYWEQQP